MHAFRARFFAGSTLVLLAFAGMATVAPHAGANVTVHEYALPTGTRQSTDYNSVTGDPKTGDVYFGGIDTDGNPAVGRITPAGAVTWFPADIGFGAEVFPGDSMAMHDGDVWFGATNSDFLGYLHFNSDGTTTVQSFRTVTSDDVSGMWTPDPTNGPIYFANGQYLGEVSFPGPTIAECKLPDTSFGAARITGDAATNTLYYGSLNAIGRASATIDDGGNCSGVSEVPTLTPNAGVNGITIGGDGRVWFAEFSVGKVGAVSTSLTGMQEYFVNGNPTYAATGPDGDVYVTDETFSDVKQVHPNGTFNSFNTITGNASPTGIALGPNGALWFPEIRTKDVGELIVSTPTKTTLSSTVNPATFGEDGFVVAKVVSVPPGSIPTGDVEFDLNGTPFEDETLGANGKAKMPLADLDVGSYSITAKYLGNESFDASASHARSQAVDPSNSSVDLVSSQNPTVHGSAATVTATVNPVAPGGGTPTGKVRFKVDGGAVVKVVTMSNGTAVLKLKTLAPGTHKIVAVYEGSIDFNSSFSPPLTQVVT